MLSSRLEASHLREVGGSQDLGLWGYYGSSCTCGEEYRGQPATIELSEGRSDPGWSGQQWS